MRLRDERGERPFLWPLTSFPDRHTYSVHFVQYCHSCFEQFCWDLIRTCGFATCCLMDGTSNLWTTWWGLLLPVFFFSSFSFLIMVQVFTILFPPVCNLCSFSFKSLIWLSGRAALIFLLSLLLLVPCTCLPAAVVYPLWAFCVPLPSVLNVGSYLCLLLLSFPWLLRKSHQISISFFCDLMDPIVSLATYSRTVLVPFQRSSGVTSFCAASNAVNLLVTSAANCTALSSEKSFIWLN